MASPYKFFPIEDGGLLWANEPDRLTLYERPSRTPTQEFKGILHLLQRALNSTPAPNARLIGDEIRMLSGLELSKGCDALVGDEKISGYYEPADENLPSLASSRWIMRHTKIDRLAARRRENYMQWVNAVAGLPCCQALYPELPIDCVPYMFPLLIDRPETHFFSLKQLGVPIWRWDGMAVSRCAVAANYRLRLLHLPCHQELTTERMAWITHAVQQVMHQSQSQNC